MDRDQALQEPLRSYGERDRVERNLQNTLNQWFPNPRQNVSRQQEQRMAQTVPPQQHQCGLCCNEMRLPTTLAVCNHSFCRDCLKDHVNRSVDKRCPLCKQVRVNWPINDLKKLIALVCLASLARLGEKEFSHTVHVFLCPYCEI